MVDNGNYIFFMNTIVFFVGLTFCNSNKVSKEGQFSFSAFLSFQLNFPDILIRSKDKIQN